MARIITVTSGKGGVGKTSISLNLSLSLASKGYKVCLFDADLGLANVSLKQDGFAHESNEDHIQMLSAIKNRDGDLVEKLVRAHILKGKNAVLNEFANEITDREIINRENKNQESKHQKSKHQKSKEKKSA